MGSARVCCLVVVNERPVAIGPTPSETGGKTKKAKVRFGIDVTPIFPFRAETSTRILDLKFAGEASPGYEVRGRGGQ